MNNKFALSQAELDLRWLVESPSLIVKTAESDRLMGNRDSGVDCDALANHLNGKFSHRVGRYFEHLTEFYLTQICGLDLIARGKQIAVDGRTVGELDFVFRNQSGDVCHLETAVKFYLRSTQPHDSGSYFIGPNSADTFERKMERLFGHQLPLSIQHFPEVTQRMALVRGMIFYHPAEPASVVLPSRLSPDHLRGIWIHSTELRLLDRIVGDNPATCRFLILKKPYWLAAGRGNSESTNHVTLERIQVELKSHFGASEKPRLLSLQEWRETGWCEVNRIFVVSASWPN